MKTVKKAPAGASEIPAAQAKKLKVHSLAACFPMLDGETLQGMKLSIQTTGQQHPGVLDQDGVLLDGRMRKLVCEELGIPFKVQTRHFATDLERERFIFASNKDRRQFGLDQSAALIVYRYLERYEKDGKEAMALGGAKGGSAKGGSAKGKGKVNSPDPSPQPSTRERFGIEWSVSDHRAKIAIKLFKEAQDLLQTVITGGLTLNAALKALQKRQAMPKKKVVQGKPHGNDHAVESMLGPDAIAEIEGRCKELAEWIDGEHDDVQSRNEADDVVEAYFRQRKTDRQDGAAANRQEEQGDER